MMNLKILYEDNHLLVVIKPVGILSQADNTQDEDMLTLLKEYLKNKYNKPGNVYLGLVHRLDRMVSGIMVFAKTSKAASRLSEQVRTHQFQKEYLAVLHGKLNNSGTLINYLTKDEEENMVSVTNEKEGKYAELSYHVIDSKNELTLVNIHLKTGRPHQIRVQFSHINCPLYGDKRYGKQNDKYDIALFAYRLTFIHPVTKESLIFKDRPQEIFPFTLFSYDFI